MKKIFLIAVLAGLLFSMNTFAVDETSAGNNITLTVGSAYINVDDEELRIDSAEDIAPVIIDNRVMVPIRVIIEKMGGSISWFADEQKMEIRLNDKLIAMWLNNKTILVNSQSKEMDVAPQIINGRTMLPVRFVADHLDCQTQWAADTQTVIITYSAIQEQVPEEPHQSEAKASIIWGQKGIEVNGSIYYIKEPHNNVIKIDDKISSKRTFIDDNVVSIWNDEEWIYYCTIVHGSREYGSDPLGHIYMYAPIQSFKIYKIKPDGTNKTIIKDVDTNYEITDICMIEGKIFYKLDKVIYQLDEKNHKNNIYIIKDTEERSYNLISPEYAASNGTFYIKNIKTGAETKYLNMRYIICNTDGSWIYCWDLTDGTKLYKMRLDGSEKTLITADLSTKDEIILYNDSIMFLRGNELYRLEIDESKTLLLKNISDRKFGTRNEDNAVYTVTENWILYINPKENLYRTRWDGTENEKIE